MFNVNMHALQCKMDSWKRICISLWLVQCAALWIDGRSCELHTIQWFAGAGRHRVSLQAHCARIIYQSVNVNMDTALCKMNAYRTHILTMRACAMHCPGDWRARPSITLTIIWRRGPAQSEPPGAMRLYYMPVGQCQYKCISLLPKWLQTTCIYVLGMLV